MALTSRTKWGKSIRLLKVKGLADPLGPRDRDLRRILGGVNIDPSYAVSTLRLLIPPETLRMGAEYGIDLMIAYLRGDIPQLDPELGPVRTRPDAGGARG